MSTLDMAQGAITPVTIGRHRVGPGERTFVVAEAGVNHNGCIDTALRLVDAAVDAGADAVKFQMFRAAELVTATAPTASYQKRGAGERSQRAMLSRLELTQEEFARIKRHCDERSILFFATPFGESDVGRLVELGVMMFKIASTDLTNPPLLRAAVESRLPLIVSTGASTAEEIRESVASLFDLGAADRLVLLHCVSCYPTPLDAINLRAVGELEARFKVPCGLSDHTLATQTGAWAVAAGAHAVEKHFTLDPTDPGPDHAMSLDPMQLATYIAAIRQVERALGSGGFGMTNLEKDVRTAAGKSLVASMDVKAGTTLTRDMVHLKRPGTGIGYAELDQLIGRCAAVDIPSDTMLSWSMLE
jgi:N-acetylneuraminate synthase/N,N'-diacetyllegionaminate synthase